MSGQAADIAGHAASPSAAESWEAVRHSADIQFAPLEPLKQAPPPAWLGTLNRALKAIFGPLAEWLVAAWPVLQYILVALAVVLVGYLLWRILVPVVMRDRGSKDDGDSWAPTREQALALLSDADQLASQGRYGEAAHLLLLRSVGQIRAGRPGTLVPASTAREIAGLTQLPVAARGAFGVIAGLVERSLFALRDLDAADWTKARAAYSDFALADLRA